MNGTAPTLTKETIAAYQQQRAQEAAERMAELLKELDCDMVAVPQITADGRIVATIQIVAR
jgi:hypothetical protein